MLSLNGFAPCTAIVEAFDIHIGGLSDWFQRAAGFGCISSLSDDERHLVGPWLRRLIPVSHLHPIRGMG
jgi:hypothetical protein